MIYEAVIGRNETESPGGVDRINRITTPCQSNDVICGTEKGKMVREKARKLVSTDNAIRMLPCSLCFVFDAAFSVPLYSLKDVLRAFSHAITLK